MRILLAFTMLLSLASCSNYYYCPTYQQVPTNTKRHELTAQTYGSSEGGGYALSYTATDHIGVKFSNYNISHSVSDNESEIYTNDKDSEILEFGLYGFNSQTVNKNINVTYAISGEYSLGEYGKNRSFYKLKMNRFSVQPSFALTSRFFDVGFSSRFSYLDYNLDIINEITETEMSSDFKLHNIDTDNFYFFEPNFFIGIGYEDLKVTLHSTHSVQLGDKQLAHIDSELFFTLSLKMDIEKIIRILRSTKE